MDDGHDPLCDNAGVDRPDPDGYRDGSPGGRVSYQMCIRDRIFVEQSMLHIPKRLGKIHMDLMRVYETFCLIP